MKFFELMDKKYLEPIPEYGEKFKNWESILIEENNEKLVSLKNLNKRILVSPQYFINGIDGAEDDCKARESIANKLESIANKLPEGYSLLVWDSYRTLKTQKALFDFYYNQFKNENGIDGEELMEYTKKFVSLPSNNKNRPSPHNTGAAVDLTICDSNGDSINLGTYFDDFRAEAYTRFYEEKYKKSELTETEKEILLNRRVLCNLFSEEGFANYPYEIWHKSFGDQMACKLLDSNLAIYGGIEAEEV